MKKMFGVAFFLLVATLSFAGNYALVVGNDSYPNTPLQSPVNDAKEMYKKLNSLGFSSTLAINLDKKNTDECILRFFASVGADDTVLLYYAGYAGEVLGMNYLLPVDFGANSGNNDIEASAINLNSVIDSLRKSRRFIVILDAAVESPFKTADVAMHGVNVIEMPKDG
ncbi:MAG TPA: caspase family protein, partial [Treponemataceae bacterium]|nr:caspase family protein [Treponemataceae bacterium]